MKVEKSIDILKILCYKSQAGGAGFVPKVEKRKQTRRMWRRQGPANLIKYQI